MGDCGRRVTVKHNAAGVEYVEAADVLRSDAGRAALRRTAIARLAWLRRRYVPKARPGAEDSPQ